jgi:electron transport complex protein RnfG
VNEKKQREPFLGQAWLVLCLSLVFGAGLAGVQVLLKDRIEQNKTAETLAQAPRLVPGAKRAEAFDLDGKTLYRALDGRETAGWVIPAGGQGFADRIEILLGLDRELESITGLYVLEQKETPGLGNKIVEESFRSRFRGQSAESSLSVTKKEAGEGEIAAVTGATISSESVVRIVNRVLDTTRNRLKNATERND